MIDAGYTSAAAVKNMHSHPGDDVFAVARLTVTRATTAVDISRVVHGLGARSAPGRERLRTTAGRQLRRARHLTARAR